MRPGPRPKPSRLKVLKGERRPSRLNTREPQAPVGVGPAPPHLSVASKAIWAELAPLVERTRIVTVLDPVAFEILCDAIADYRQLRLDSEHAAFASGAWKRATRLLSEFGLTPSSRTCLVTAPARELDSFETFLSSKPPR